MKLLDPGQNIGALAELGDGVAGEAGDLSGFEGRQAPEALLGILLVTDIQQDRHGSGSI